MLLVSSRIKGPRTVRRRMRSVRSLAALVLFAIGQLSFCASADAATATSAPANEGLWTAIALGLVVVSIVVVISRSRIKAAQRGSARARELAEHLEYERNVAQQELLRRLEEERELA